MSREIPASLSARPRIRLPRIPNRVAMLTVVLGIAAVAPAAAQTQPAPTSFDDVLRKLDLKAKITPAPDFVVKSRPAPGSINYLPVGTPHPDRPVKVMTPAEVAATTADLDVARTAQQRRAGVKAPPVPIKGQTTGGKRVPKTLP